MVKAPKHEVILLLGSNKGDREKWLFSAIAAISNKVGPIVRQSNVYESEPWGFNAHLSFYNQAIVVKTEMGPRSVLHAIWKIEEELGRKRIGNGFHSRTIDIDILTWENRIFWTKSLQVPHIQIQNRKFALKPLCELAGDTVHPVLEKRYNQLLSECKDQSWVREINTEHVPNS